MLLKLKSKWRKRLLLSSSTLSTRNSLRNVLLYTLLMVIGLVVGIRLDRVYVQEPQLRQPLVAKAPAQDELIQEYQSRLEIKEQALTKLNEINTDLRKKYRFLLGQLAINADKNIFEQSVHTKNAKKGKDSLPVLQHFSVVRLSPNRYQYRIFLINEQQNARTRYILSLKFENGETEQLELDHRGFSLPSSNNKQIVLPFLGIIESHQLRLKTSTFLILDDKKKVFEVINKYEEG